MIASKPARPERIMGEDSSLLEAEPRLKCAPPRDNVVILSNEVDLSKPNAATCVLLDAGFRALQ
jgi:hypothetical protein